jgi:hypothetical protein
MLMKVDMQNRPSPTHKAQITAVGSMVLAFLASQHHLIHMFILLVTFGTAGMSFLNAFPLIRRGMLLVSLIMVGITIWQTWRWRRSRLMNVLGSTSIVLTLGLVIWSIAQFGL